MVSKIRFTVETDTLHLSAMDETEVVSCKAAAIKAVNLDVRWKYLGKKTVVFVELFPARTSISSLLQNKITMF